MFPSMLTVCSAAAAAPIYVPLCYLRWQKKEQPGKKNY